MEPAREGGSIIFPILAMNSRDSTQAKLAAFITVTSDFYADLGRYYRARTDAWIEEGSTGEIPMRVEPSKLARLVIAYHEKFGGHVPESALRLLAAGDLAPILQESLATGAPLSETGWGGPQCLSSNHDALLITIRPALKNLPFVSRLFSARVAHGIIALVTVN